MKLEKLPRLKDKHVIPWKKFQFGSKDKIEKALCGLEPDIVWYQANIFTSKRQFTNLLCVMITWIRLLHYVFERLSRFNTLISDKKTEAQHGKIIIDACKVSHFKIES